MEQNSFEKITGDEAFYFKHEEGKLVGMVLLHVDDFMMASTKIFVEELTEVFQKTLTVSKIEDDKFRFCGVDVMLKDGKIHVEMEDYAESIEEDEVQKANKTEKLNRMEMKVFCKITGKN